MDSCFLGRVLRARAPRTFSAHVLRALVPCPPSLHQSAAYCWGEGGAEGLEGASSLVAIFVSSRWLASYPTCGRLAPHHINVC